MNKFIHLECFSEYSINKSIIRIESLIDKAKSLNFQAIAITDINNLFGAIKFYKKATQNNIKPIFAAVLNIDDVYQITAYCMNEVGYKNLCYLISLSYENQNNRYTKASDLVKYNDGLIILHNEKSLIAKYLVKNETSKVNNYLERFNKVFIDRNYINIKRTGSIEAENYLQKVVKIAEKTNTPLVATADVLFLKEEDYTTHEAKVCITSGGLVDDNKRKKLYTQEQYLKTEEQMLELFSDIPSAITNTVEIAKRCNYKFLLQEDRPQEQKYFLPEFKTPDNADYKDYFINLAKENLTLITRRDNLDKTKYQQRLDFELEIIINLNFVGYFLIVADFIRWAKDNDIPVGLGRGSGAGSLVAYTLGITGVDPIKYDLLFERFLNPSRVSMPDFDIDFSPEGRDRVIEYVANKYGKEKVSQIITFGTMAAKGVIRDTGRVLGIPYGLCDNISKLIPNDLDINIDRALNYQEHLKQKAEKAKKNYAEFITGKKADINNTIELSQRYSSEEEVTSLIDLAKELEGLSRNIGTHAGGVIIAPSDIANFCPTYKAESESDPKVCGLDKNDIEEIGLVKFDFLGLSNLDTIKKTIDNIKKQTGKVIDINQINLEDDKVYKLYRDGDTTGLFQMESAGMRKYLKDLKPTSINDIIAMNALYRPGAMDYIDNYIEVKHGKDISFPHPILEEVLTPTNGVFVYQEQVMRAAQKMAGFSLGDADILRRAMGKKKPEEMAEMREKFIKGAAETNNIEADKANEVFDYIDKFSGYGFNKSHSVAYALISYQTAYLKTYYRATFTAAVISGVANDTDKVEQITREALDYGFKIIPPNINISYYDWTNTDDKTLVYGLGSIKGIGLDFISQIIRERENGKYSDLFDFCLRIPKKYLNKRAIESLIYADAFSDFKQSKKTLIKNYTKAIKHSEIRQNSQQVGQGLLFTDQTQTISYKTYQEYSFKELLAQEKSVLGFYFSAHPVDEYKDDLIKLNAKFLANIADNSNDFTTIALIENIYYKDTPKGKGADVILADGKKKITTRVSASNLTNLQHKLKEGDVVCAYCEVLGGSKYNKNNNYKTIMLQELTEIEDLKSDYINYMTINIDNKNIDKLEKLKKLILESSGNVVLALNYSDNNAVGTCFLPEKFNVKAEDSLILNINNILGPKSCKIYYKH